MNIDGTNTLACTGGMDEIKDTIGKSIRRRGLQVVKETLSPDLSNELLRAIRFDRAVAADRRRWMLEKEWKRGRHEDRKKLDDRLRVHPVRVLLDLAPGANGGTDERYLGLLRQLVANR